MKRKAKSKERRVREKNKSTKGGKRGVFFGVLGRGGEKMKGRKGEYSIVKKGKVTNKEGTRRHAT